MRAREFVTEAADPNMVGWSGGPETKDMTAWRDEMAQLDRGRNALTTMPIPKQNPGAMIGADSPFINKPDPALDPKKWPEAWSRGTPYDLTRKMIDPRTGDVRLGPNQLAKPGTEDYALLKKQLDPVTKQLNRWHMPDTLPSKEVERKLQQKQQQDFKPATLDKGKEVIWPMGRERSGYQMYDLNRQKFRT
jgi:hypothetical protein